MVWLHGECAWGFIVVPLILTLLLWAEKKRRIALDQFAPWLHASVPKWRKVVLVYGISAAWMFGLIALMGPATRSFAPAVEGGSNSQDDELVFESGEIHEIEVPRLAHDVILLLDASASMAVADTRLGVERLEVAKEVLDEIIGQLNGQAVAIYAFTSELTTVVPLTMDYLYARLMLRQVRINEGDAAGTDLMEAFDGVRRRHARGGAVKVRTVILVTDGGDTRLQAADASQREKQIEALVSLMNDPRMPLTLLTVGVGSHGGEIIPEVEFDGQPVRSSLDEDLLTRLGSIGDGAYYFSNDLSSYDLARALSRHLILSEERVERMQVPCAEVNRTEELNHPVDYRRQDRVPIVLASILLTGLYFLRGVHEP